MKKTCFKSLVGIVAIAAIALGLSGAIDRIWRYTCSQI